MPPCWWRHATGPHTNMCGQAITLRLRDQHIMWMHDGCEFYMDSYMASNGSRFMVHGLFQKPPPGGRPNTKPGDYGTPNAHNCWFILFHNVWGPTWIEIHWNRIWLRALSQMTSHYTWGPLTTQHGLGGVLGWPLDTLFGVSQFYGQGSWLVKWPQVADHSNPQLRQLIHLSIGSTSNLYFPFLK